jgi:hypothetical protein
MALVIVYRSLYMDVTDVGSNTRDQRWLIHTCLKKVLSGGVEVTHLSQRNVRNWVTPMRVTQELRHRERMVNAVSGRVCECADCVWVGECEGCDARLLAGQDHDQMNRTEPNRIIQCCPDIAGE